MAALLNPTSTSTSSSSSASSSSSSFLSPSLRRRRRGARRPLGVRRGCLDGPSGGWLLHDAGAEVLESLATAPDLPEQSAPGIYYPRRGSWHHLVAATGSRLLLTLQSSELDIWTIVAVVLL
ncbi:uncharacterized protein LOC110435461 [Sorghum bicolor]|uniref:uncharacterized protein LOC110435461 n=1 Tax=Sorghum bicolor TaxID=4558 RepID=UPI000B4249E4|nr:uncharacterized protein LOC110435461 [Sorghum bicolor]|eukprot:XP_021316685.1 uncharacterized protein LOC110435461 [Sorghum bicolor]